MTIFKTTDHLEKLTDIWQEFNPQKKQYIQKQQIKQFVKTVFNNTNIRETVKDQIDDKIINVWLKQYLSQMHNLQEANVKDVQFKFDEVLDFLDWLVDISQQGEQNQNEVLQQSQNKLENSENNNKKSNFQEDQNQLNHQQTNQQNLQKSQNISHLKNSVVSQNQKNKLSQSYVKNNSSVHQNQNQFGGQSQQLKNQSQQNQIDQRQSINREAKNKQDFSLKQLQNKYKEHLEIIFQHYCKLTYATGNDPTFQQIQHKTSIMTINKFMIFSKQFQIAQILPKGNAGSKKLNARTFLIQTFKKNAECYKQMNFQQFCQTIWKIAQVSFSQLKKLQDPNDIKQSEILSYQKVRMLQYMQISFFKQFKQKMKRLNINYVLKTNTNNESKQKKIPFNYKFKFQPANHPSHKNIDMIAQHINSLQQERKQLKSQRKEMLQQRKNKTPHHDLNIKNDSVQNRNKVYSKLENIQRSSSHKNYINASHNIFSEKRLATKNQLQNVPNQNKNQRNSNQDNLFIEKKLAPLLPPKKISKNSNSSTPNIPNGITGYAKIHQAKKGQLINELQLETPGSGSRKMSKDGKGYRLNSIVEQAKNIVSQEQNYHSYKVHTSSSGDGISSSHPLSRERYDIQIGNNSRVQNNVKKSRIDQQVNYLQNNMSNISEGKQQLRGLIDLNDSDEDQFLEQHLKKQKEKKNQIGRRIDKKISSLNIYK